MSDDYLFEGTGSPDPDIQHLETVLASLRFDQDPPTIPKPTPRSHWPLRIAALLLLGVGTVAFWQVSRSGQTETKGWSYVLHGRHGAPTSELLRVGAWLEAPANAHVELQVADIGRLTLDPGSRVKLISTNNREHRLRLEEGRMEALVTAPPRLFVTETPAGDAVDLGCRYTLDVDKEGNGTLEVTLGMVMYERDGHESYVPYGARCEARKDQGLGTPYFTTATGPLVVALRQLDFGPPSSKALPRVLESTTVRDTLTLWNLLQHPRLQRADRQRVLDRIEDFVGQPVELDRAQLLARHPDALRALRLRLERYW